jgi:membrane protease YdiL (CAAX protease family)
MNPMVRGTYRSFWLTLLVVWAALSVIGIVYARVLGLPARIAAPVIAAFLWEASFYLVPGFAAVRKAIEERWRPPVVALCLSASALAPYCVYTLPTGRFQWPSLVLLAALAAVVSFWHLCLPKNSFSDVAFLAFMAIVVLAGVFSAVYPAVAPKAPLDILGRVMWTRLGVTVMLSFRRVEGTGFGFIPTRVEWGIGIRQYFYFLPIGLPLALAIGFKRFQPKQMEWWELAAVATGTFLGILWVGALPEEFLFRGLLQQWLCRWVGSRTAGLIIASVVFGLVHLSFRPFPNWRFALVATLAGFFYGRAYSQSGGIRAAMVAHALVNTTTKMFFAG